MEAAGSREPTPSSRTTPGTPVQGAGSEGGSELPACEHDVTRSEACLVHEPACLRCVKCGAWVQASEWMKVPWRT